MSRGTPTRVAMAATDPHTSSADAPQTTPGSHEPGTTPQSSERNQGGDSDELDLSLVEGLPASPATRASRSAEIRPGMASRPSSSAGTAIGVGSGHAGYDIKREGPDSRTKELGGAASEVCTAGDLIVRGAERVPDRDALGLPRRAAHLLQMLDRSVSAARSLRGSVCAAATGSESCCRTPWCISRHGSGDADRGDRRADQRTVQSRELQHVVPDAGIRVLLVAEESGAVSYVERIGRAFPRNLHPGRGRRWGRARSRGRTRTSTMSSISALLEPEASCPQPCGSPPDGMCPKRRSSTPRRGLPRATGDHLLHVRYHRPAEGLCPHPRSHGAPGRRHC